MFLVNTVDKPANRMFILPQITLSTNPTKSLRWSECLVWSLTTRTWRTCRVWRDSVYSAKPGVFLSCDTCSVPCGTTSSVSTDWEVLGMGVVMWLCFEHFLQLSSLTFILLLTFINFINLTLLLSYYINVFYNLIVQCLGAPINGHCVIGGTLQYEYCSVLV